MAVDQKDRDRLAHRHDQPALIVECKRVLVDRNLDSMIAGGGELLVKYDRDVFARRQIDHLLGAEPAVSRQSNADLIGAVRAEIMQDRANQDGSTPP